MQEALRNKKQMNTNNNNTHNSFNMSHSNTQQLNTRIISETSSSGVHSDSNSDRGSNSEKVVSSNNKILQRHPIPVERKNKPSSSKNSNNQQDHRIVREPNSSGSNSSNSFKNNNRPNSMVVEQRAPRMLRGRNNVVFYVGIYLSSQKQMRFYYIIREANLT